MTFSEEHLHFILKIIDCSTDSQHFSTAPNRTWCQRQLDTLKCERDEGNTLCQHGREIDKWRSHTDYCKFLRVKAAAVDVRFEDYANMELQLLTSEALPT